MILKRFIKWLFFLEKLPKLGIATQSTTYRNDVAGRAVDGIYNTNIEEGSCTHTDSAGKDWWKYEVSSVMFVESVELYNRENTCCQSRLSNCDIYLLGLSKNVLCANTKSMNNVLKKRFKCDSIVKSKGILIECPGKFSLCEVDIFEFKL